jgi:uncharacterized membrane protein YkoI
MIMKAITKKPALLIMLIAALITILALVTVFIARNAMATDKGSVISAERAKAIAVQDAGESMDKVTFTKSRLESEKSIQIYEVDFYTASRKYEYEINAATGAVRERDAEALKRIAASGRSGGSSGSDCIGTARAKNIALEDAGLAAGQVTFRKANLEYDDGTATYEISFVKGASEYEYEIDANSGKIIEKESDHDNGLQHGEHGEDHEEHETHEEHDD